MSQFHLFVVISILLKCEEGYFSVKIGILDFCHSNNAEACAFAEKFKVGKTQITDIVLKNDEIYKT